MDKTNIVPSPLGAQDLVGSSSLFQEPFAPKADVHGRESCSSPHPALHAAASKFPKERIMQ